MSKKYKAAMDKITVTEELREKIIKDASEREKIAFTEELKEKIIKSASEREKNILTEGNIGNISEGRVIKNTARKKIIYPDFVKFSVAAAACILLVISVFTGKYMLNFNTADDTDPYVYNMQGVEFFKSTAEIEKYLGYSFKTPQYMPDGYAVDGCRVIAGSLIEICYSNNSNSIVYRTEKTTDDISGDYNKYGNTEVEAVESSSVTLKSNDGAYYSAVWKNNEFSYSLSAEKGVTKETIIEIIRSLA